jgi:hypothetical protein
LRGFGRETGSKFAGTNAMAFETEGLHIGEITLPTALDDRNNVVSIP